MKELKRKKKNLDFILFYNIFTKCWYGQPLIGFHLGPSLILLFYLPIRQEPLTTLAVCNNFYKIVYIPNIILLFKWQLCLFLDFLKYICILSRDKVPKGQGPFKNFQIIYDNSKKKFINFFQKFGGWPRPPSVLVMVRHWVWAHVVVAGSCCDEWIMEEVFGFSCMNSDRPCWYFVELNTCPLEWLFITCYTKP